MNTRDDSILYSGGSSASFASDKSKEREAKERERKQEALDKRQKLLPSEEIVMSEIDKQIAEVQNIDYLNVEQMLEDEHFKAELMARKKLIEKLKALKITLSNALRDNKS